MCIVQVVKFPFLSQSDYFWYFSQIHYLVSLHYSFVECMLIDLLNGQRSYLNPRFGSETLAWQWNRFGICSKIMFSIYKLTFPNGLDWLETSYVVWKKFLAKLGLPIWTDDAWVDCLFPNGALESIPLSP